VSAVSSVIDFVIILERALYLLRLDLISCYAYSTAARVLVLVIVAALSARIIESLSYSERIVYVSLVIFNCCFIESSKSTTLISSPIPAEIKFLS